MAAVAEARPAESGWIRRASSSYDPYLLFSVLALVFLGLIMVYSSSIVVAIDYYGPNYFLERELVWIGAGLVAMVVGIRVSYTTWRRLSTPLFAGSLFLLVAVLLPHVGHSSNGAQRWFQISSFIQIQPSELVKLTLAIYMAHWLTCKGDKVRSFNSCSMPFGIILGLVCLLILMQPDMGTAAVVALAMVGVYLVAGARLDHFGVGLVAAFFLSIAALHFESYRAGRLSAWLNPWKDPSGTGYHTIQALLALGLGGLTGVGLGNSQQKYFLPAPYTDSIFAVTAEELGLMGALAIVGLFVLFAYRGFKIAMNAPDDFGKLLAVGLTGSIVVQAFLNIAVITSTVPFTGVPLPFISYGGSSLIVSMLAVGILLNISRQSAAQSAQPTKGSDLDNETTHQDRRNRGEDRRPRVSRRSGDRSPGIGQPRRRQDGLRAEG